jgi:hypothetical protein
MMKSLWTGSVLCSQKMSVNHHFKLQSWGKHPVHERIEAAIWQVHARAHLRTQPKLVSWGRFRLRRKEVGWGHAAPLLGSHPAGAVPLTSHHRPNNTSKHPKFQRFRELGSNGSKFQGTETAKLDEEARGNLGLQEIRGPRNTWQKPTNSFWGFQKFRIGSVRFSTD